MEMELRVCEQCYTGEHGDEVKTAITRDMVAAAERLAEHKDAINLGQMHVTKVTAGEPSGPERIPVVIGGVERDTLTLRDTHLAIRDDEEGILVYSEPADILQVLTRNLDQISERTLQDVSIELAPESAELIS